MMENYERDPYQHQHHQPQQQEDPHNNQSPPSQGHRDNNHNSGDRTESPHKSLGYQSYESSTSDNNVQHQVPVHVERRHQPQPVPEGSVPVPVPKFLRRMSLEHGMTEDSGMGLRPGLSRARRNSIGRARTPSGESSRTTSPPRYPSSVSSYSGCLMDDDSEDVFENEGRSHTPQTTSRERLPPTGRTNNHGSHGRTQMGDESEDVFENEGPRANHGGIPTPRRYSSTPRRAKSQDSVEEVFEKEGHPVRSQEPPRLYPSVSLDDSSTNGSHQRRSSVSTPGAQHSHDNSIFARKAALQARQAMDESSNSNHPMDARQTGVPGASFSTDNGVYARKAGLRGRTSVRSTRSYSSGRSIASHGSTGNLSSSNGSTFNNSISMMEDESNNSVPGAVHETDPHSSPQKLGLHEARGHDSLTSVDQNIQQRQEAQNNQVQPGAVAGSGSSWRIHKNVDTRSEAVEGDRYRYQPGASMQSVSDGRYQHKVENQEDRMNASLQAVDGMLSTRSGFDGDSSTPGIFLENNPLALQEEAIRAKLDNHFGVDEIDRRIGDFSHVTMLQPPNPSRRSTSTSYTTREVSITRSTRQVSVTRQSTARIGTEMEQEVCQELPIEFMEDEPVERTSHDGLPRELVDADVEFAREQALPRWKRKSERLKLFRLSKTGMVVIGLLFAAVVATIMVLLMVGFKRNSSSNESSSNGNENNGDLPFAEILPAKTKAILAEQDPDSPQYMALQWLQEEDLFLSYPVWRQQQRFAASSIYFSFYHDDEQQDMPWFQPNVDECDWRWNPDVPSICDSRGQYLRLALRLDARSKNNVNLPSLEEGPTGGNSTSAHMHQDAYSMPMVMPPEIGMLTILERLSLSHVGESVHLDNLWPVELLSLEKLNELEVMFSPNAGGTVSANPVARMMVCFASLLTIHACYCARRFQPRLASLRR